jgi:hypothetical protein
VNIKEYKHRNNIEIVFRHQSPFELKKLEPLSYKELKSSRGTDMPKKELLKYLSDRVEEEKKYHSLLPEYSKSDSFLYATIVGYHKMESPKEYPGFTYYFSLTDKQIEECLFHIVADKYTFEPIKGIEGLETSLTNWELNSDEFQSSEDEWFDAVDPRIEVVIPFAVKYFGYMSQEEDR